MKRRIFTAIAVTAIAGLGIAQRADATEAHVKVAAMAECQGYVITVSGTDFTGAATIGLWGDASGNQGEITAGGITPGAPAVEFAYHRTKGHYEGGVTLYFEDGKRSSATYAFDVPACPDTPSSTEAPATTTTSSLAPSTTTSSAAPTMQLPTEVVVTTTTATVRASEVGTATSIAAERLPATGGDQILYVIIAAGLVCVGILACLAVAVGPRRTH